MCHINLPFFRKHKRYVYFVPLCVEFNEAYYLMIGVVGRNAQSWGNEQLIASLKKRGLVHEFFNFADFTAKIRSKEVLSAKNVDIIKRLSALIIRPLGRGSLEEIIFRMDLLHTLDRRGIAIINSPHAIERCVDKYYALALLEESGVLVPRTVVTENVEAALKGFQELGSDVICKPLFGSRGVGMTRIFDMNVALRIFKSIKLHHGVFYLQEFVHHGSSDVRALVVDDRVIAAMQRVGTSWKTNISQGARPISIQLTDELEQLAIKAANVLECKVAGVDILECQNGPLIVELNSQPGWRGLQSVTQFNIADSIVDYVLTEVKK